MRVVAIMSKVVRLPSQEFKGGETSFVSCPCGTQESMVPVVMHGGEPFIAALICSECSIEVPVVNGYIKMGDATYHDE